MADRNRELVPDKWGLVRGRALTTGLSSERWYSEHSGVCRRGTLGAEAPTLTNALTGPEVLQFITVLLLMTFIQRYSLLSSRLTVL